MKKIIVVLVVVLSFVLGMVVGFKNTIKEIKPHTEENNIIVLDVYGQEWVYEI